MRHAAQNSRLTEALREVELFSIFRHNWVSTSCPGHGGTVLASRVSAGRVDVRAVEALEVVLHEQRRTRCKTATHFATVHAKCTYNKRTAIEHSTCLLPKSVYIRYV